jgi:hypothetical protein
MVVVNALAIELVEPRSGLDIFATVFVPGDVELWLFVVAQYLCRHEGADVQADAVVQVWVPADGLLG